MNRIDLEIRLCKILIILGFILFVVSLIVVGTVNYILGGIIIMYGLVYYILTKNKKRKELKNNEKLS